MYKNYFNLNERPFRDSINPKYIYLSEKHSEALASFKYAIEHEKGFLMLTGEIGTGKTSIVKRFLMEFGGNLIVSTLTNPDLEPIDFFKILADEFGLGIKIDSKTDFLIGFKKFLLKAHENGKNVLLIIDEAHKLNQNVLDEIRMLSNIEVPNYKILNIIFVGQTEFNDLIFEPQNYSLRQRITINYLLEPLSKDETIELILHRIKCAGGTRKIFSAEALQSIHQYTSGYPRLIVALCDRALLSGFAKSVRFIEKDIIDECAKDLNIAGFELRNESDEHPEKFSTIEFNKKELNQKKSENIIYELKNKIESQKCQKLLKSKKWQLYFVCGVLIMLTSISFYFINGIISTEPSILAEKEKKINTAKNYHIDKDRRLTLNDLNRNTYKESKILTERQKSSSGTIPSASDTNDGKIAPQKEILHNTIKTYTNKQSNSEEGSNRKIEEYSVRKAIKETQQVENIQPGSTTQNYKIAIPKSKSSEDKNEYVRTKIVKANKTQSKAISLPKKSTEIPEKKASEAKIGKIAQVNEKADKIMLEKKSNIESPVQQNSQKEPKPPKEVSNTSQNRESLTSQIETNTINQTDNNVSEMADLNESSLMKQQNFGQEVPRIKSASILDEKPDKITLKDNLQSFLQDYCYAYQSKQLDKFLAYFSFDAKENGKPIKTLIPKYRRNFTAIDRIEYNIFLEKFSYDKISNNVRIEGKFSLRWQPYNSSWRENSGKIFMDLLKNNDSFKVLNLDYYGSRPSKK